jgi:hypothetical protein
MSMAKIAEKVRYRLLFVAAVFPSVRHRIEAGMRLEAYFAKAQALGVSGERAAEALGDAVNDATYASIMGVDIPGLAMHRLMCELSE